MIPTLSRHASLARAIRSVLTQRLLDNVKVQVVVVDNSEDQNARAVVEALKFECGTKIQFLSEPRLGIANVRNTGVSAAKGDWVAFLDDDEEASDTWLHHFLNVANATNADAVFGPVTAMADGGALIENFGRYFSRSIKGRSGQDITELSAYLGTNNSMFNRRRCFSEPSPFDQKLNQVGGEDSLFLQRLVLRGHSFAWAPNAEVIEWVPPGRLNWHYVRKRRFLSGQIRVLVQYLSRQTPWVRVLILMSAGVVQCSLGVLAALLCRPFSKSACERALVVCSAGLGKVFWGTRYRPSLYGAGHVS